MIHHLTGTTIALARETHPTALLLRRDGIDVWVFDRAEDARWHPTTMTIEHGTITKDGKITR